jgi:hypothetical protein
MYNSASKIQDCNTIRNKYNIPANKNIVIYLPFPFSPARRLYTEGGNYAWQAAFSGLFLNYETEGEFRLLKIRNLTVFFLKKMLYLIEVMTNFEAIKWVSRRWNEPAVIKEIERFCHNNDLIFIAKPRKKFPYVSQIFKSCSTLIKDNEIQNNPSVLQELFSIAELVIGYQSTAVLESVLNKTPYLNIESPPSFLNNDEARLFFHRCDEGGMYSYEGVVKNMNIPQLINNLHGMNVTDFKFNSQKRSEYMEKFLGEDEPDGAENLLRYLEENNKGFL